jgi:hypothetical protein
VITTGDGLEQLMTDPNKMLSAVAIIGRMCFFISAPCERKIKTPLAQQRGF